MRVLGNSFRPYQYVIFLLIKSGQSNILDLHYTGYYILMRERSQYHCLFACWWLIALMSADKQEDIRIDRLTNRETGRETYRQTDRQTDRQTVPFPFPISLQQEGSPISEKIQIRVSKAIFLW